MNEAEIEGGCMCGSIRYRLTSKPIFTAMCHCSDCRRSAGAQSVAWVTVPLDQFLVTKGTPQSYQSSPKVLRTFCPICGTSLTYTHQDRHPEIDITTGSLDEPERCPPSRDVFCSDRLSWVAPSTGQHKE